MVGEGKRLTMSIVGLLERLRHSVDRRELTVLTDRQLRDAGIDLTLAGRGRAASGTVASVANLEGLR